MKSVELIGRRDFTLEDVYEQEARLQRLYPGNRNVRPKIRQQGFLEFIGRGRYRLRFAGWRLRVSPVFPDPAFVTRRRRSSGV